MYINFQQNWVSRSVKTVRTNIFAKNSKLYKFATILIILFLKSITSDMHHHKTYMYVIFSKIGLIGQSKPCTQIYWPKNANCINLQLAIFLVGFISSKTKNRNSHKFATTISNFEEIKYFRHSSS